MRNLPCLSVSSATGLNVNGKAATTAMEAADGSTTAPQPPHTTSSYFATTYYHLTDDECTFHLQFNFNHSTHSLLHIKVLSSLSSLVYRKSTFKKLRNTSYSINI